MDSTETLEIDKGAEDKSLYTGTITLAFLASMICDRDAQIKRNAVQSVELAIDIGRHLHEAKKMVKHGEWQQWVDDNCPFSLRTAQQYMRVAAAAIDPETIEVRAEQSLEAALDSLARWHLDEVESVRGEPTSKSAEPALLIADDDQQEESPKIEVDQEAVTSLANAMRAAAGIEPKDHWSQPRIEQRRRRRKIYSYVRKMANDLESDERRQMARWLRDLAKQVERGGRICVQGGNNSAIVEHADNSADTTETADELRKVAV